jgi:hypothetical protein
MTPQRNVWGEAFLCCFGVSKYVTKTMKIKSVVALDSRQMTKNTLQSTKKCSEMEEGWDRMSNRERMQGESK